MKVRTPERGARAGEGTSARRTAGGAAETLWPGHHPRWRQRLCACIMAHGSGPYERYMAERKRRLLAGLEGTILEIGAGTGANLPYLSRRAHYIAVEPNRYMHKRLHAAAREQGVEVDLRVVGLEAVDVPEASVDAVVCTLVLCSVEDPAAVVARALRLLRPGGRFVFIEHVAAPRESWLRRVQSAVRPVWRMFGDGCRPDRETWRTLEEAGMASLTYERFRAPAPVVSPHIAGIGRTDEGTG